MKFLNRRSRDRDTPVSHFLPLCAEPMPGFEAFNDLMTLFQTGFHILQIEPETQNHNLLHLPSRGPAHPVFARTNERNREFRSGNLMTFLSRIRETVPCREQWISFFSYFCENDGEKWKIRISRAVTGFLEYGGIRRLDSRRISWQCKAVCHRFPPLRIWEWTLLCRLIRMRWDHGKTRNCQE